MAASILKAWMAGGETTVVWIEFEAYARRVFANATPDWYRDPARFAGGLIQAHGVIPTQCLSIDVLAPFVAERAPAAAASGDLVGWLAADAPLSFVKQAMSALIHRFDKRVDLVLKLRSPRDLLGAADAAIAFDDLDDVATALMSFMRAFADKPLAGVLLEYAAGHSLSPDDIDAYQPIISAARHYGWLTALSFPGLRAGAASLPELDLDVLLLPQLALSHLDAAATGVKLGGGLNDDFWAGSAPVPASSRGRLLYGCVPAAATPETVVARVRALTG